VSLAVCPDLSGVSMASGKARWSREQGLSGNVERAINLSGREQRKQISARQEVVVDARYSHCVL
jgi:hypothetical protein